MGIEVYVNQVVGSIQGNAWTEYCQDVEKATFRVAPGAVFNTETVGFDAGDEITISVAPYGRNGREYPQEDVCGAEAVVYGRVEYPAEAASYPGETYTVDGWVGLWELIQAVKEGILVPDRDFPDPNLQFTRYCGLSWRQRYGW